MPEDPTPDSDDLRVENELRKLQLEQEFGAVFGSLNAEEVAPDIENLFLRNVLEFERQCKNGGTTTMFEFLGRPPILPPDTHRNEADFQVEVDRLMELFEQNSVRLDILGDYPAETIYRFIVDEFMQVEKDNFRIPGMFAGYIYEEFHPNHRLDIDRRVQDLFDWLTNPDRHENFYGFDDTIEDDRGIVWSRVQFLSRLRAFRRRFDRFNLVRMDVERLEFDEENGQGKVRALIEIEAFGPADKFWFIKNFADIGLRCAYNYWSISAFKLPGLFP